MKLLTCLLLIGLLGCSSVPKQVYKASGEAATLIDESKPIHAVFLSEPTESDGKAKIDDQFSATIKISKTILPVLSKEQRLYFVGSLQSYNRLLQNLGTQPSNLSHVEAKPYMWIQDLIEFGDSKEGLVSFVSYGNHSMLETVTAIMKTVEPGSENRIQMLESNAIHGTVGGNFERWPHNVAAMGISDFPTEESASSFAKQIFPQEDKLLLLPTSWLNIGHMDEVVKLLRYQVGQAGDQCELTFLINNPELALRLLQQNPKHYLLDEMEYGQSRMQHIDTMKELCSYDSFKCSTGLLNEKALQIYKQHQTLSTVFKDTVKSFKELKEKIITEYKNTAPPCQIRFVEAPMLYSASLSAGALVPRSGRAIFPSLTNGLLINNKYIVADPGNFSFRKEFTKIMKKNGFEVVYVPLGKELFTGSPWDGHIHCMTQVLRRK